MSRHHVLPSTRRSRRRAVATLLAATAALVVTPATAGAVETDPFGAEPFLLGDLYPGPESGISDEQAVLLGDRMLFQGTDAAHGSELWVSDGTAAGTRMLADLCEGECSSYVQQLTAFKGQVFFTANGGPDGVQLWVTDGTEAGTEQVEGVNQGSSTPSHLEAAAGRLWFTAGNDADSGVDRELWVSDGTAAGTRRVADIRTGLADSEPSEVTALGNGNVAFLAKDAADNVELWVSNGTDSGTVRVKDINGTGSSSIVSPLAPLDGKVVFAANDGLHGTETWISDGTSAGTSMVSDLVPGASGSAPHLFTQQGDAAYFVASSPASGSEIWRTDGTTAGTTRVTEIGAGPTGSHPSHLTVVGRRLFFLAIDDGDTGLYVIEPAMSAPAGGARLVSTLATDGQGAYVTDTLAVNRRLFFVADLPDGLGRELYTSDGTDSGTRVVLDVDPNGTASITPPHAIGNTVVWSGTTDELGYEYYAWNTQRTRTVASPAESYTSRQATRKRIRVPVSVKGGARGITGRVELWKGDQLLGTARLRDGKAVVRVTRTLAEGRHEVRATFLGSWSGRTSTSRTAVVHVG